MSTSIITPKFIVSYPSLFKPRAAREGDKPKFEITMLFGAWSDQPVPGSGTMADLKAAVTEAGEAKWGKDGFAKMVKGGKLKLPFVTGDRLEADIEDGKLPEGTTLRVRASSNADSKPGVVDRFRGPDGKAAIITDPAVLYPGCFARASIRAFAYDRPDAKGISFGLNNVQKLDEGERIDGRRTAASEFDALDDTPPVAGDDLSSAMGL